MLVLACLETWTPDLRGTDVEDVKFVINYDYPNSSEDYIHRIGRTGRCSQTGTAYAFFTQNNSRQARDLVSVLTEANQRICPKLSEMARFGGGGFNKGGYRYGTFRGRENRFGGGPRGGGFPKKNGFGGNTNNGGGFGGNMNHKRFGSDMS